MSVTQHFMHQFTVTALIQRLFTNWLRTSMVTGSRDFPSLYGSIVNILRETMMLISGAKYVDTEGSHLVFLWCCLPEFKLHLPYKLQHNK